MTNDQICTELLATLKRFNRGVRSVTIECGNIIVRVASVKAAKGVAVDMLRSRSCKSVTMHANHERNCYEVNCTPA